MFFVGFQNYDVNELGMNETYEMYQYVTDVLGQQPVVIESQDLAAHPGIIPCQT